MQFCNVVLCHLILEYILKQMQEEGTIPEIKDGDLEIISQPLDWFGLNCYNKIFASASKDEKKISEQNGGNFLDDGTAYYPEAVYEAMQILRKEYELKIPVYVTENGTFAKGEIPTNGIVEDEKRVRYFKGFLREIARANADGLDISGYYLWSLMDNFEWNAGYSMQFGICSVDSTTQKRTMKRSALEYKKIIEEREIKE